MRKQYLHLSAYPCDTCAGTVIAGSLAVRENAISKEADVRQVEQSAYHAATAKAQRPSQHVPVICCRWNGRQQPQSTLVT